MWPGNYYGVEPLRLRSTAKPAAPSKPAQTQAKMDLAKKHPASLSAVGLDSDAAGLAKPNVKDMSQEDFAKLPESTKKRLRGDEF